MTCNNANVPDGLLIGLEVALAVAIALWGEAFFFGWLVVHRRASVGWLAGLAIAAVVGVFSVWQITDIWGLRVALQAPVVAHPGIFSGSAEKGVCQVFWSQQLCITVCAIMAIVLAAPIGLRAAWSSYHRTARA
jgi:hypothetical protein